MTQEINKQLNMIHYDKNDTIKKDMNMNVCIWMDGSKNIRHILELGEPELVISRSKKENIKKDVGQISKRKKHIFYWFEWHHIWIQWSKWNLLLSPFGWMLCRCLLGVNNTASRYRGVPGKWPIEQTLFKEKYYCVHIRISCN